MIRGDSAGARTVVGSWSDAPRGSRVAFSVSLTVNVLAVYFPSDPAAGPSLVAHGDKVAHLLLFAAVMWTGRSSRLPFVPLAALLAVHAVASELVQHALLDARRGDPWDALADLAGIAVGAAVPVPRRCGIMGGMTQLALAGRLLVSTPALRDPNFLHTVVLLLDHDQEGSLGVVINRPTEMRITDVLPPWSELAADPDVVFQGGPVALDSALGLAAVSSVDGEGEEPLGFRRVTGPLGLVDLDAPPELIAAELRGLRIFAGYAGWGPGQLEAELKQGAWYVVDAEPGDAFSAAPEGLWRAVLRRQRGDLALVATCPEDPSLN